MISKDLLTDEQKECIAEIKARWSAGQPLMTIVGSAGTGKTSIVKHIVQSMGYDIESEVAFATFTGKAALVLTRKGNNAQTIHSLIYHTYKSKYDNSFRIKLREELENPFIRLIVVDEVSMVSEKMMQDLQSFGVPILCLGDDAQLPPVNGRMNEHILNPDFKLTQIHRQAETNSIIKYLTQTRTTYDIKNNAPDSSNLRTVSVQDLDMSMLLWADQVLCCTNRVRNSFNSQIRAAKGFTEKFPQAGDKIICLENYHKIYSVDGKYTMVNGLIGFIEQIEYCDMDSLAPYAHVTLRPEFDSGSKFYFKMDLTIFFGYAPFDNYERKARTPEQIRVHADFGYAISVHKSQGSEWDNVFFYQGDVFGTPQTIRQLAYTGASRAAEKLILCQ